MKKVAHFLSSPRLSFVEVCLVGGVLEAVRLNMMVFAFCWAAVCTVIFIALKRMDKDDDGTAV